MKKGLFKKILLTTGTVMFLLVAVLCVHIYMVTRPKPADANTRVMARIDFKQDITNDDANKIATWMYQQKGVDHVLTNPATDIVVFTFSPLQTSADKLVEGLKANFNYKAVRFVPSEKDLKSGCPVAATSFTYKAYSFIKHIF